MLATMRSHVTGLLPRAPATPDRPDASQITERVEETCSQLRLFPRQPTH